MADESTEVVPGIPASVLDKRALKLVSIARQSIDLALETAPNWRGSKFTKEDIVRLDDMRRDLTLFEVD